MKMAMWLDYKPTRNEGKGFLRNLNIWIHRDITGDRCGLGWGVFLTYSYENKHFFLRNICETSFLGEYILIHTNIFSRILSRSQICEVLQWYQE